MNQIVNPNAQKRWVTNAMFLCDALSKINDTVKSNGITLNTFLSNKCTKITNIFNTNYAQLKSSKDHELKAFYQTCRNANDSGISDPLIMQNIRMELLCMSPIARKIASKLVHPHVGGAKVPPQGPLDVTQTILGTCYKLGYLNRLLCILAEETAASKKDYTVTGAPDAWTFNEAANQPAPNTLLSVYLNAQRVRSSRFGIAFGPIQTPTTIKDCEESFKKAQRSYLSPFNKDEHRRRIQNHGVVTNQESYILSLTAGAAFTQLAPDSTLGLVEKALSLPERCDISGTTTDAIGAALTLCAADSFEGIGPHMYILSCMTSMCLSGHHSLSEMGAALSLWSDTPYNPLIPNKVLKSIEHLKNVSGNTTFHEIWISTTPVREEWFKNEWIVLAGTNYEGTINKWDFTEENWMVWKAFANVLGRK